MNNLKLLNERTANLKLREREIFEQFLVGALSQEVSQAAWESCLLTAHICFEAHQTKEARRK